MQTFSEKSVKIFEGWQTYGKQCPPNARIFAPRCARNHAHRHIESRPALSQRRAATILTYICAIATYPPVHQPISHKPDLFSANIRQTL